MSSAVSHGSRLDSPVRCGRLLGQLRYAPAVSAPSRRAQIRSSKAPTSPSRSGSARYSWILSLALLLPALVGLAVELERGAIYNWDLMGYVGCLVELDTSDPEEIHRRVLEVVHTEVPAPFRPRLLAHDRFRNHPDFAWGREVATNPQAFVSQLDWYRPRVGFTALAATAHQVFGQPLLASIRAAISASYVALGLILWACLGRQLGPWLGAAVALAVVASEPVTSVTALHTADLPATVVLLGGLWALLRSRSLTPAWILFTAAVLVRPDHAVTCVVVLAIAAFSGAAPKTPRIHFAGAMAGLTALYVLIGTLAHHPGWIRLFSFTFVERRVDLSDARFDPGEYLAAFPGTLWDLGSTSTPIFATLALLLCIFLPRRTQEQQTLHCLTVGLSTAFALRFLLFPVAWDRFWLPLDLWVVVTLVITLSFHRRRVG
ncbi:MAG: hypothetical protein MPN21_12280 [Thermoanaerobaculia bacterium]|nr:hypothetical protein [Thermoanaerobaculia bacterium]